MKIDRKILIATPLVVALLMVSAWVLARRASTEASSTGKETTSISVRFPIPIVESGQAPFYVANDNGNYNEQKLVVRFDMGSPEFNPIKMVASNANDFGVLGGPDTLLVARSRGQKLKAVAILHRNSNFSCLVTLKSSGITSVPQLNNKKVGFYYGHISTDVLRNLFRRTNTPVVEVDTGFNYSQLIARQIDASWAFTVTAALELPMQGVPINIISPSDYGIVTHGYTIFATEEMVENHPDIVLGFLRATLSGVKDVVARPEGGVAAIQKRDKKTSKDLLMRRQTAYNEVTSDSVAFPPGYMDRKMFQETYDRLFQEGVIERPFNIEEAYTTKFLEIIHGRKF
jgi:NitT/TauT family transport system substrate-binding protein